MFDSFQIKSLSFTDNQLLGNKGSARRNFQYLKFSMGSMQLFSLILAIIVLHLMIIDNVVDMII